LAIPGSRNARGSWRRIALLAVAGTAACLALSLVVNYLLLFSGSLTPFGHSVISAIVLPLLIGVPVFLYAGIKREELRCYKRELTRSASYDALTACFNGMAFRSMVERRAAPQQQAGNRHGAFLVVEASGIREIRLRFGLAWSDEALQLVAETIRANVRSGDVVGRTGANEFGVFLPGASEDNALDIGERIRAEVAEAYFAPGGGGDLLKVSVGGVVFEKEHAFDEMFNAAGRLLVEAGPADRLRLSFIDRGVRAAVH
jgi:diguanylate cyclase